MEEKNICHKKNLNSQNSLSKEEIFTRCIRIANNQNESSFVYESLLQEMLSYYGADWCGIYEHNSELKEIKCLSRQYREKTEQSFLQPELFDCRQLYSLKSILSESGITYLCIKDIPDDFLSLKNYLKDNGTESLIICSLKSSSALKEFLWINNPSENMQFLEPASLSLLLVLNEILKDESAEVEMFKAITKSFISVYILNLKKNSIQALNSNINVEEFLTGTFKASDDLNAIIKGLVTKKFVKNVLKFIDLKTLPKRLNGHSSISIEFIGKISGWCRGTFIPVSFTEKGELEKVIFSVHKVEDEKQRELEIQHELKLALENQNEVYIEMLKVQSNGIIASDLETNKIILMNESARQFFELKEGEEENLHFDDIIERIASDDKSLIISRIRRMQKDRENFSFDFWVRQSDGSEIVLLARAKVQTLRNERKIIICSLTDITENKRLESELVHLSETDSLTQISNRGSGEKRISRLLNNGEWGMFFLFDIDNFKYINDTFGHSVGDKTLVSIADCLKMSFRTYDVVMRLGGDEFAVFAVGIKSENVGQECLDRLFNSIKKIRIKEMKDREIEISLGAVLCDGKEEFSFDQIYQQADKMMYECKKVDGSCYMFYHG